MKGFVSNDLIQIIEIEVEKEITSNKIRSFILNYLTLNNINLKKEDIVFINYNKNIHTYQVFRIDNKNNRLFFELFLSYDNSKNKLYFNETFFCIYSNDKFFYYQKLEYPLEQKELTDFIFKKFAIKIDECKFMDKKEFDKLEKEYKNKNIKPYFKNLNKKNSYQFKIYFLYLITVSVIFYFFIIHFKNTTIHKIEEKPTIQDIKKKYHFNSFEKIYSNILKSVKLYKIQIKSIEYNEKNINLKLLSEDKRKIYSFLEEYRKYLLFSSITKLDKKLFEVNCVIILP